MNRFSIGFTDDELEKLESIREYYERMTGVRVSRCAIIKKILFESSNENGLFPNSLDKKSFKTVSKKEMERQDLSEI